jgi:hypothetical protein
MYERSKTTGANVYSISRVEMLFFGVIVLSYSVPVNDSGGTDYGSSLLKNDIVSRDLSDKD